MSSQNPHDAKTTIHIIKSVQTDFSGKNWIGYTTEGDIFIIAKRHGITPEVGGVLTATRRGGEIVELCHNMRKIY